MFLLPTTMMPAKKKTLLGFVFVCAVGIFADFTMRSFRSDADALDSLPLSLKGHRRLKRVKVIGGSGTPPKDALPLQVCEGDCDHHGECAPGLKCFQRTRPFTAVPGCEGGEQDSSFSDYCVLADGSPNTPAGPTPSPNPQTDGGSKRIKYVGNNFKPPEAFPLGLCEGDCDRGQCAPGLVCFERGPNQSVPGCDGGDRDGSNSDYCILAKPGAPTPAPVTQPTRANNNPGQASGTFLLKLYWQKGYFWQEEKRERKWCMIHHYEGLKGSGKCWYGRTLTKCHDDQLYITKCKDESRQRFKFIFLASNEVLIKLGNGDDGCLKRSGRDIYIRPCDQHDAKQRWYAPKGGFQKDNFQISQKSYPGQCVTQDHHPKEAEVVELHSCSMAASKHHETDRWNRYYD